MKLSPPRHGSLAIVVGVALALGACSDDESGGTRDGALDASSGLRAGLRGFDNAADFYAELRSNLAAQAPAGHPVTDQGGDVVAESSDLSAPTAGGESASDSAPTTDGSDSLGETSVDLTSTNVQETGVDEADRVKTDSTGTWLYVLDPGEPNFLDYLPIAEPLPEIGIADAGGYDYPANPSQPRIRVLRMDPAAPSATAASEFDPGLAGENVTGFYISDDDQTLTLISSAFQYAMAASWDMGWGGYAESQVTVSNISVSDPAVPSVGTRKRIDGQVISSRRIGDALYLATRYSPSIPGVSPWTVDASTWQQAVADADINTLMPSIADADGSNANLLVQGENCRVLATNAERQQGDYIPPADIITLAVLDLATLAVRDSTCFLGQAETLYASTDAIYMATSYWNYGYRTIDTVDTLEVQSEVVESEPDPDSTDVLGSIAWQPPTVGTAIHRFELGEERIRYSGSGDIPGHLGWNEWRRPFRLSERDGVLRVASFANRWEAQSASPVTLSLLRPDGNGSLEVIGQLPNENYPAPIGKPGEELYASRFLGDRAYLVTFLQTDPLYVVDLANPADPKLLGELEITGYSDYLHPVDSNHLLGIGKAAVEAPGEWSGGLYQGLKLALFDVADPAKPSEVQSMIVGERGTETAALYDHRAITVQAANESHPMRVAFGIDVYGEVLPVGLPSPAEAWARANYSHTGLYGFEVRGGDAPGIRLSGAMVVSDSDYATPWRADGDRSVIADDGVFYIHGSDVYTANWFNLGAYSGPQ